VVKLLKKIIFKLYVIFLMAFTVWYGYFMYPLVFGFEGKEKAEASLMEIGQAHTEEERLFVNLISSQGKTQKTDLGYRLIEQPYIEGRFHHIGFEIQSDNVSICVHCHGNTPHDKSREVRSFLNMHAFYTACETCHIRGEKDNPNLSFRWYDKETGEISNNPLELVEIEESYSHSDGKNYYPTYGDYGAKIAPGLMKEGKFSFLKSHKDKSFVDRYLAEKDKLTAEQKSQMEKVIHKQVNKQPVECNFCHQEEKSYIPFAELGYPPRRVQELIRTSAVGMIEKYKEFYIPNFLSPGKEKK